MTSTAQLSVASFFGPEDVLPACGETTRDGVIRALVSRVASHAGRQDAEALIDAVLLRERQEHTAVAEGIAIPHARVEGLERPLAGLATFPDGIPFAEGCAPVRVVFLVLIPQDDPALYLRVLRSLGDTLAKGSAVRDVSSLKDPEDVCRFFKKDVASLPQYLTAADIMEKDFFFLRDTDSVQACVDAFIARKVEEIPVLDAARELVGVARADLVMRSCLPEYLMWMQDLTPIANFQPFADFLRSERTSPISKLLTKDFPSVSAATPAVAVAGDFARLRSPFCYVTDDRRLLGVIRLSDFLNKIFRG